MEPRKFVETLASTPQGVIVCWNIRRSLSEGVIDPGIVKEVLSGGAAALDKAAEAYYPVRSLFDSAAVEALFNQLSPKAVGWRFADQRTPKRDSTFGSFITAELFAFDEKCRIIDDDKFRKHSIKRNPGTERWRLLAKKFNLHMNIARSAKIGSRYNVFWLTRAAPPALREEYGHKAPKDPTKKLDYASWVRNYFGLYHVTTQLPFFLIFSTQTVDQTVLSFGCQFAAPNFVAAFNNFRFRHASRDEAPDEWGRSVHLSSNGYIATAHIGAPEAIMSTLPVHRGLRCDYVGTPERSNLITDKEFMTFLMPKKSPDFLKPLLKTLT
jgi:hypothetical protein